MESPAKFSRAGLDGKVVVFGEGKVVVAEGTVSVTGAAFDPVSLSVRDVKWVRASDYRIELGTASGSLMLFSLGLRYEDMLRAIHSERNETPISDCLVYESPKGQGVRGEVAVSDADGTPIFEGKAEFRLYETALIVVPEMSPLVRMRYSDIGSISSNDWKLDISEERGRKVSARMLGREHDPLVKAITEQVGEMKLRARNIIKAIHPGIADEDLSRLSVMMREGRSAGLAELSFMAPEFLELLERKMETELPDSYRFLMGKGRRELARFGFKHGLMDGVTGDYIWLLMPIFSDDDSTPGNAIAFEASGSDSARATYFFRIGSRTKYAQSSPSERRQSAKDAMETVADALAEINFRRVPIYLDETALLDPTHENYRFAIDALPGLKDLRSRFIGRINHAEKEKYSRQMDELLRFNNASRSDSERWKGGDEENK